MATARPWPARTLPAALPQGLDGWFNVLLVSCFHHAEDRAGRAGRLVSQLRVGARPDLIFLLGDQVYLDLTKLIDFPDNLYQGFQLPYPLDPGDPFILDVPPLSFFLADMRHGRTPGTERTMSPEAIQQLDEWVTRLSDQRWFGVFILGQSLFTEPVRDLLGRIGDYQLPNYGDFPQIVNSLVRLVDGGRPLICVTGDVHWGRVTEAIDSLSGRVALREVISSPRHW